MSAIKAGIFSFFMKNIPVEARNAQKAVVDKFNKSKHAFFQIETTQPHGLSMDACWHLNGCQVRKEFRQMKQQFNFDVVMFLDIDAIPLNEEAIDSYVEQAYNGTLVGNIQRSNHLNNGQHVFVAPSAMAISIEQFWTINKPSAVETGRSDVAEEYTWLAQKAGVPVRFYMPLRYDAAPAEAKDGWGLADGMPRYGLGTTFGEMVPQMKESGGTLDPKKAIDITEIEWKASGVETFWHNFQIRFPGQPERFMAKCEEILKT
jgi:hypothetical protein